MSTPVDSARPVRYRIIARSPEAHLFEVSCSVDDPAPDGQAFRLPTWIPGSYLIREFARNIVTIRAESDAQPVAIVKSAKAKDAWQCAPCSGPLTATCEVYAWDLSARGAHLDYTHAFFNGTSVFLAPAGMEQRACTIDIVRPAGEAYAGWRLITSLPRLDAPTYGFGLYRAGNYDELIDHPVEMGTFTLGTFDAGGVKHDVAITGRHDCDMARLTTDLAKVCSAQIDFFGGAPDSTPPTDYYAFLTTALGDAHGGLEHRASTALVCSRNNLPRPGMKEPTDDCIDFLGLASHEYFHTWNVKRIKPAAFVPYDLTREGYTGQLWIFEGFSSYYDNLMQVRAGLVTPETHIGLLGQDITRVLRTAGRKKQSLTESSFDAWIKYYRADENTPNAVVSYYVKGALVALLLDLKLRSESAATLDDVMRVLWRRLGMTGIGVPEDGVRRIATELSGLDLEVFFARYVEGTEELPLAEALSTFAMDVHLRPAEGNKDAGGKAGKGGKSKGGVAGKTANVTNAAAVTNTKNASIAAMTSAGMQWLGARWTAGGDARITHVYDGGPAQDAGLSAGDVIIAWNGLKITAGNLQSQLERAPTGAHVDVHAFRRDELMRFVVMLAPVPLDTCWLTLRADASAEAVALRQAWLHSAATTARSNENAC